MKVRTSQNHSYKNENYESQSPQLRHHPQFVNRHSMCVGIMHFLTPLALIFPKFDQDKQKCVG